MFNLRTLYCNVHQI